MGQMYKCVNITCKRWRQARDKNTVRAGTDFQWTTGENKENSVGFSGYEGRRFVGGGGPFMGERVPITL